MAALSVNVMCPWTRAPPAKTARWEATATSSGKTHNPDDVPRNIIWSDTIRNWSRHSGYRGNDFTIHAVETRYVEINSPGAENIQHVAREHFARVHEHWKAYNAGVFARSRLTAITRFSTYVISILHHVFDSD